MAMIFAFIALTLSPFPVAVSAKKYDGPIPFHAGEKLKYQGYWGLIPAGEVALEVLPQKSIDGVEAYHFAMITKTSPAVDVVYKIRESQDSYCDADLTHSIFYTKKTKSEHPRDVVIHFDWEKHEAVYSNFGKKETPIPIMPGSFDPLALFYILRLNDFKDKTVIEIPVTDGQMNVMVDAVVVKTMIKIEGKMYDAFEVTPDLEKLEGVVKKTDNPKLRIWFTSDTRKIPLKIQSNAGGASFVFELKVSGLDI